MGLAENSHAVAMVADWYQLSRGEHRGTKGGVGTPPNDRQSPFRGGEGSRLTDLNRWPSLYKSAALPLS